jgi:hypothetical protein
VSSPATRYRRSRCGFSAGDAAVGGLGCAAAIGGGGDQRVSSRSSSAELRRRARTTLNAAHAIARQISSGANRSRTSTTAINRSATLTTPTPIAAASPFMHDRISRSADTRRRPGCSRRRTATHRRTQRCSSGRYQDHRSGDRCAKTAIKASISRGSPKLKYAMECTCNSPIWCSADCP